MNTYRDKNKRDIDNGDSIPFILCTPTKIDNDGTAPSQSQDTTTDDEESSELITFSLKPRRSCHSLWHKEDDVEPVAIADIMHSEPFSNEICQDFANESVECNSLHSRSSPLPTFRSIDVMITPPPAPQPRMLYLLKPRDSQEVHRRGRHDTSPSVLTGPPFPILERRDDHRHLWQQQQQRPKLCRPIPRYHSWNIWSTTEQSTREDMPLKTSFARIDKEKRSSLKEEKKERIVWGIKYVWAFIKHTLPTSHHAMLKLWSTACLGIIYVE